jgi:outer membrane protein assembly factor BamE
MPRFIVFVTLACALAGCSSLQSSDSFFGLITPYRVEVVQGNALTKEQIEAVKPGMTRAQVRDVLGSPLLTDPFHADRWDYIFTIRRQGTEPQRRSVIVRFDGDLLKQVEAPELPTEREFVDSISTGRPNASKRVLALSEEEKRALAIPAKPGPSSEPALPAGAQRSYPPLEP